jgi:hypothetical protein
VAFRHLPIAAALLTLAHAGASASPLTWSSALGGAATGAIRENFDSLLGNAPPVSGSLTPTGIEVSFAGTAGIVRGSRSGRYAAPSLSGDNGDGFGAGGTDQPDGRNTTPYLTTGSSAADRLSAITLLMPYAVSYFGLLWGSVDGYNTLSFFADEQLVGSIGGAQVAALPNGDQGPEGTRYVNVSSTLPFNRIVATSSNWAFEFDNVAFHQLPDPALGVPVPAALTLFGLGLLGLGLVRRGSRGQMPAQG